MDAVLVELKTVVSFAVDATRVAVPPLKEYNPKRTSEVPVEDVPAEIAVTLLIVVVHRGLKKVK